MSVRLKEFLLVPMVFALVFAFAIGHTLWGRYQEKLDRDAQVQFEITGRDWAINVLERTFDDANKDKPFPSDSYWENWITVHSDYRCRSACRRLGTHLALNRELCGRKLWQVTEIASIPLFFEENGAEGNRVKDVEEIARKTRTGMFAVTWLDGHGYPYGLDARNDVIKRARETLQTPVPKARGRE